VFSAPKDKVFQAARKVIESMGLELTGADSVQGRLEAIQTSVWYGFTDDMVVRITETPQGTRVDVRSKSRVGRSDIGQNDPQIRVLMKYPG
jgi:uncharacterized protein (DUF1499 family)